MPFHISSLLFSSLLRCTGIIVAIIVALFIWKVHLTQAQAYSLENKFAELQDAYESNQVNIIQRYTRGWIKQCEKRRKRGGALKVSCFLFSLVFFFLLRPQVKCVERIVVLLLHVKKEKTKKKSERWGVASVVGSSSSSVRHQRMREK